jgi:DNA polymerase III epsilon subunit-like protein
MHWAETPIHFIDFEGNRSSGILEFGVVTLHRGEIVAARTRMCRALGHVSAEDIAVHGIAPARVAHEAPFADEWEYFARLRDSGPFAAHFASAENSLIKSVWPYARASVDFARPGASTNDWGPWIDTGRLYPQFSPNPGEARLERLVNATGLQAELDSLAALHCPSERRRYHAALYDALAGALLLRALLLRPEFSSATIPWLLQMSTLDPERRGAMQQGELL